MYLESNSSKSTGASTSRIRPLGWISRSDPPGLIRTNFSPISPFVLIAAIESSGSFTSLRIRIRTRAWYSARGSEGDRRAEREGAPEHAAVPARTSREQRAADRRARHRQVVADPRQPERLRSEE